MNFNKIIEQISEYGLESIRESVDVECKLAIGKDGKGGLPTAVWESYSAFANTQGGVIILGVKENTDGSFGVYGIDKPAKIRTDFFNTINNKDQVSENLLTDKSLIEMIVDNKTVILIAVPRAARKQQPIYLKKNPLNAYMRQNDGDYRLNEQRVSQMLAEREHDSRDDEVLPDFGLDDLHIHSLRAYRQLYASLNPYSDINQLDDTAFLRQIGGYGTNRATKQSGLTKAGLLMFGRYATITEIFADYFVDYQEWGEDETQRWLDRITPDGNWSGNLFDFYNKTILKLSENLKVPFVLKDGIRQEDTPVHKSLREALVNSIIHADYSDKTALLIVKKPTGFYFRNPGAMRMPIELAWQRSESDCRNRKLQQMFRMIRICEQAGSGLPDIELNWRSQHWLPPNLSEHFVPSNHTILQLNMTDLFPKDIIQALHDSYGVRFDQLDAHERTILAIIATQKDINHQDLKSVIPLHPADITKKLQSLVKNGFLVSTGGRWAVYRLKDNTPNTGLNEPSTGLNESNTGISLAGNESSLIDNNPSSTGNEPSLAGNGESAPQVITDLSILPTELQQKFIEITKPAKDKKRLKPELMQTLIIELCSNHYLTSKILAQLLDRNQQFLRADYLLPMVKNGKLMLAYPNQPTHENQAYKSTQKETPQ